MAAFEPAPHWSLLPAPQQSVQLVYVDQGYTGENPLPTPNSMASSFMW